MCDDLDVVGFNAPLLKILRVNKVPILSSRGAGGDITALPSDITTSLLDETLIII